MNKFREDIWKIFQQQGPSFIVMILVTYFFYTQFNVLSEKVESCNNSKLEVLTTVVQQNTKAFDRNSDVIERNTKVIEDR